jgi:hypothetical protein
MEASHEDNIRLPYAQAFVYLLCTHARFPRRCAVALCRVKGRNTNYPEQICRKATAVNSYTVRRMKIINGFWVALNFLGLLRPRRLIIDFLIRQSTVELSMRTLLQGVQSCNCVIYVDSHHSRQSRGAEYWMPTRRRRYVSSEGCSLRSQKSEDKKTACTSTCTHQG